MNDLGKVNEDGMRRRKVFAVSLRLLVLLFLLLTSFVITAWCPLICRAGVGAQDP